MVERKKPGRAKAREGVCAFFLIPAALANSYRRAVHLGQALNVQCWVYLDDATAILIPSYLRLFHAFQGMSRVFR